ncbi:MAG: tryptophan synthase subunit alpha [Balneolaceae bacterium]|nr:MAG: tryptophan synthase subunit alpha [Balneolaceae bacterium]
MTENNPSISVASPQSDRLGRVFKNRKADQKLMSLFITAGYPHPDETVDLVLGFEKSGADIIELGMPFSDPLADGPTIQHSSEVALANGITMDKIFDMVIRIREASEIPIVLMGYINPVFNYGIERFFKRAAECGADGVILPDVPVEESGYADEYAKRYGVPIICLVAPNTGDERMQLIDQKSNGFVYCVSIAGVTGTRDDSEVSSSVDTFIQRVNRKIKKNPVMIGFGIRNHESAMAISKHVDGFIVGSALIDNIRSHYPEKGWKDSLFEFVKELKHGK